MRRLSILAVAIFFTFFPAFAQSSKLLWSKATGWGEVRVRQQGDQRFLMFADEDGETEESRMSVAKPYQPQLVYVRQMMLAITHLQRRPPGGSQRFLVVGLGGASLSNALLQRFPKATVTSIELEPVVVEAARRFFFYQENERSITVVDDARRFLQNSDQMYDAIFLDAFDGVEVPESLRTVEFAELLDRHLKPAGAVIANVHFVPEQSSLRYRRTLGQVFSCSYITAGVAQGVGVYSHQTLLPPKPNDLDSPDRQLLREAPEPLWDGVEPYRDGQP
jgi:spermidine synthase